MRISVNDKMKEWVAEYIRAHRSEGCISIHVVFSKFNEDFKATFKVDPIMIVSLMIEGGFLCGRPAKLGFSIWLPEDAGKGKSRLLRLQEKIAASAAKKNEDMSDIPAQKGEDEMKKKSEVVEIDHRYAFEVIPHPVTGEVNVLELIRLVMEFAGKQISKDAEMDGGYAVCQPKFAHLFEAAGLPDSVRPDLTHVMMKMGLFKKYSRETWGVMHSKAAQYFITSRSYLAARESFLVHRSRNMELARLRSKVEKLEAAPVLLSAAEVATVATSPVTSYEEEAMVALLEAEHLTAELAKSMTKTKALEVELADARAKVAMLELERENLVNELKNRPAEAEVYKQAFNDRLSALRLVRNAGTVL